MKPRACQDDFEVVLKIQWLSSLKAFAECLGLNLSPLYLKARKVCFSQTACVMCVGIWEFDQDSFSPARIPGQVWLKSALESSYCERNFTQLSGTALYGVASGRKKCWQNWTQAGFHSFKEIVCSPTKCL